MTDQTKKADQVPPKSKVTNGRTTLLANLRAGVVPGLSILIKKR